MRPEFTIAEWKGTSLAWSLGRKRLGLTAIGSRIVLLKSLARGSQ